MLKRKTKSTKKEIENIEDKLREIIDKDKIIAEQAKLLEFSLN